MAPCTLPASAIRPPLRVIATRTLEVLGQFRRQHRRHHFQHQHGGTSLFQRQGVLTQFLGAVALALHAVASQRMHGLGRQAQMRANRDAALNQKMHHLGGPATAFQFDHVGARFEQGRGAAQGLFTRFLVGAKGQVANQPRRGLDPAQPA